MGYMAHHAIVVTSQHEKPIRDARISAINLFNHLVSPIIRSKINACESFFIAPDGSKEGWDDSNEHDEKRKEFKEEIDRFDGYVDMVEVRFGGDESGMAYVVKDDIDE